MGAVPDSGLAVVERPAGRDSFEGLVAGEPGLLPPEETRKLAYRVVEDDDYVATAMFLLWKFKEPRALPPLVRIVADPRRSAPQVVAAARIVGQARYQPGLDALLALADSRRLADYVSAMRLIEAIEAFGDRRALPTLDRLAAMPDDPRMDSGPRVTTSAPAPSQPPSGFAIPTPNRLRPGFRRPA